MPKKNPEDVVFVETRFVRPTILENTEGSSGVRFEAVVSEADYINGNRRMYPQRVLFPAFEAINGRLELHPGSVDHPDPYEPPSYTDMGIAWESFRFEGSQVVGTGKTIQTQKGRDLEAVIQAGIAVGFSTRGRGASEEETIDGRTVAVLTEYELVAVDAVVDPSVGHARIRSFTKESLDLMEKELEETKAALEAANARIAELEGQLAEVSAAKETAEAQVAADAESRAVLEARVSELEAEIVSHAGDALEAKLVALTSGHRFAAAIIAEAKKLSATLETAENVVAILTPLIEGAASAANEDLGSPRGDTSTTEDSEVADGYTDEEREELKLAKLL